MLSALIVVLAAAGCSTAKTAKTATTATTARAATTASAHPAAQAAAACRQPPEAVLPGMAGTLTEADSGVFCLPLGSRLAVFLTPPSGDPTSAGRWSAVVSSSPPVLTDAGAGMLTAPIGVTPGIFQGTRAGEARLSSGTAAGKTWQVTVVVS
ncbi:hypothetical protein P3T36_003825 [Kitasatospora sp. MAP12-15]|uniref:hypothetical protein n=1 Tax=unclassified Kitasatospora TaxID=2633591 RepID=UPI00247570BA|nr:hypothetical protein [Kitasatospora sp. MAP12-44]MDH6108531.1 hypothetical protein [Kitasatospora sp. MAP12-44]